MSSLINIAKSIFGTGAASGIAAATSYAISSSTAKVSEAASSMLNTFGGTGPLTKIGAGAKSFVQMQADAVLRSPNGPNSLVNLSMSSASNIEPSPTASQINAATGQTNRVSLHKVTLKENGTNNVVEFDVMPEIVEQHTVEYEAVAPPQFPGAFQKYKGNSATQWQLNIMFVSRTVAEATRNYNFLMMLRGWTKPFYGENTALQYQGKLGAPPPVLTMTGLRNLIGPVPVVITSLNWTWQKDVDYIATTELGPDGKPIPFPTILSVPIQLVESFSINQFNQFSLDDFRAGRMGMAFNRVEEQMVQSLPDADLASDAEADARAAADEAEGFGPR